ncbi:MFS transporter [Pseudonocardia sp.]|uniref:MFS transporter n=1 Tax=Pseudonocardia sp. TaxID=60912 RepID=UPI00262C8F1E|nr:MFS transporter [Pseudonocardia sp.]
MLSVLRNRRFRLAWVSWTLTSAATSVMPVALTLHVLDSRGGLAVLGLVLGARTLGIVLGAVLGGIVTDGYPRRTVLTVASAVRGAAILASVGAFAVSVPLLCACVLLTGVGEGIFRGAYQALIGEVVPEAQRQPANAVSTLSSRLLLVGGPGLAAVSYAVVGGAATLAATGALWLASAAVALLLPRGAPRPSDAARRRPFADYGEVLREVGRHRWFVAGLGALMVWLSIGFAVQQLTLPLVSRELFGTDAFLAIALGAYSAGAVVAALVLGRFTPRPAGVVAFAGLGVFGLVPLSLAVPDAPVLVVAAYVLGGAGIETFNILWFSAIQREVAPERLGRVFAFDFMVSYGVTPLGLVVLPVLLTGFGTTPVLVACGVATLAAGALALLVPGARGLADPRQVPAR